MLSKIKTLLCLALFVFPLSLNGEAAAAVPIESSHYNSNTFANLNTLTSTGPITFTIAYDAPGDIKWYKDGALLQTDVSVTSTTFTTAWTSSDYGQVKQMKVNSTNVDGTSIDTVWNVEVQQTGTAMIALWTDYHLPKIAGDTIEAGTGWTNLPSLYLFSKRSDNHWMEYVSEKTYIVKCPVLLEGTTLYINPDTVKTVYMQGLPALSNGQPHTEIRVQGNGAVNIDKVNFYGWNTADAGSALTVNDESPVISSYGNNDLKITNSNFRHVMICFKNDQSDGDLIENNSFYEGNYDDIMQVESSKGKTISNNILIYTAHQTLESGRGVLNADNDNTGTVIEHNRSISKSTDGSSVGGVSMGRGTRFVSNDVSYSGWNLLEYPAEALTKYNNLHDNGGHHNGFNGMYNYSYSVNDYVHHILNYACWYFQMETDFDPDRWPHDTYLFNAYCRDSSSGMNICGMNDSYFYNYTSDNATNNIQMGEKHIVFRKSDFSNYILNHTALRLADVSATTYDYVRDIYMIDSVFHCDQTWADYVIHSDPQYAPDGNPVLYSINSFRKNSSGTIQLPYTQFKDTNHNGEVRSYAWLDVLVQDASGNPVPNATVTIENRADANYPAINVLLPPPPPDLDFHPVENLPMPTVQTFDSIQTGANGHTPAPNYGWSENVEAAPALQFYEQKASTTTKSYQYRITATYNSQSVSRDVTPDTSWFREDPIQPAKTVVLTFDKPAGKYALNVNAGIGSGLYDQGQSVNIAAGAAPAGKVFDKWIGDTTTVNNVNSASTYIVVPSSDVSVTAYYKDITYHLTVVGGAGSGDYPAGKITVVEASTASATQVFYKWTGDTDHVVSPTVYSSTLIMPAHDVTVAATYRNPVSYTCRLTVADGEGTDFYAPGDNVPVSAPESPFTDMIFDHWEGDTANLADASSFNTTLTAMPDDYLIVYPVYRASGLPSNDANLSNLIISGGALYPRFSTGISGYTGIVANSVAGITVTPVASKGLNSAISVNGTRVNSGSPTGTITLNTAGSTVITIVVTAPDATTTKTYTITIRKAALATGYTLTAPNPASGEVGAVSGNFTVTPNGKYTGTITLTPSGGGLSTPLNITFSNSDEARMFTITPAAAGTVTLTPGNSGGLADPAAVTYTAYMPGTLRNACRSYPNPADFSKVSRTTIAYTVASESAVTIRIYTIAGELVKMLVNNETRAAGEYTVDWQGDTESGRKAASGVYFCAVSIGKDIIKKKIAIIR